MYLPSLKYNNFNYYRKTREYWKKEKFPPDAHSKLSV